MGRRSVFLSSQVPGKSLDAASLGGQQPDRAEQAGGGWLGAQAVADVGGQLGLELQGAGVRETLRVLFVAEQAIQPGVGHADFQGVLAGLGCGGDVHHERRLPEHAEIAAVYHDFGKRFQSAQIQQHATALAQAVRGQLERPATPLRGRTPRRVGLWRHPGAKGMPRRAVPSSNMICADASGSGEQSPSIEIAICVARQRKDITIQSAAQVCPVLG